MTADANCDCTLGSRDRTRGVFIDAARLSQKSNAGNVGDVNTQNMHVRSAGKRTYLGSAAEVLHLLKQKQKQKQKLKQKQQAASAFGRPCSNWTPVPRSNYSSIFKVRGRKPCLSSVRRHRSSFCETPGVASLGS